MATLHICDECKSTLGEQYLHIVLTEADTTVPAGGAINQDASGDFCNTKCLTKKLKVLNG